MWRDHDRYRERQYVPDTFWLLVAALLFAACGLVWLIGQVAAILFGPHHQHLPVRLVDMLGVLLRLPGTWDDPAQAWPPSSQPLLPGPVGMYAAAVLTFWLPALAYGLLVRLVSPRARRRRKQRGARWASWWQLRRLLVLGPRRGRIILGRRDRLRDRLLGRLYLAVEQCHSVLAFGPPGSFKTHGLVIPAILEWQGNLVTTSIKPDVLRATCAHRASLGAVWVYDPLALSGVPGARWTPLAHCHSYGDARRIGRMLADAADIHGHKAEDANYWQLLGAKLLSVLLFAAAGTGRSMADVARWVDIQDVDDVAQALMEVGNQQALDAWAACTSRPENTLGSVYGTAETLLDVYGDPVIAQSAEGCDLDIDELLTGANNTLYLYAPASEQERLRPLFELLVSVVIYKAEQLAAAQAGGVLDPRLFLCLDEAGNCAAIKKLPQLATTGRGQGIQLLTIWHDEAQLQHRYGHLASTVLNGHRAKLLLSGQADPASLELASKLVGDEVVIQTSETSGGDGRASLTESTAYRRLLPPEALRQLKPRRALLIYGHLPPVRIRLRPWFRSRRLVTLAMAVDAAVPHPAMAVDDLAPVQPLRPTDEGEAAAVPHPSHPEGNGAGAVGPDRRPDTPSSGPARPTPGGVSRLDRVTLQLGVAVAVVIALCSYAVSATSLYALGCQAGYSWWQAAAVPVVADGPAIYGMFRIISRSRRGARGAGYGWLLVGCGTAASIGGNVAHAHPNLVAQAIAAAIPLAVLAMLEGLKGDAGEVTRLTARAANLDRAGALAQPGQHPEATIVRRPDPIANGDDVAVAVGSPRRALPAGPRPTDNGTVGARLQAAYAQQRPDGQPWTARTLAEAAGCGRSSAASFLQRQRPPARERTP